RLNHRPNMWQHIAGNSWAWLFLAAEYDNHHIQKLHLKGSTMQLGNATVSIDPTPHAAASPWPTFWIACIAVFLVSIDSTVLFAAFGALQAAFPAATPADLSWVLNAYTVVYATMLIPAGGLADAHGRK